MPDWEYVEQMYESNQTPNLYVAGLGLEGGI